MLEDIGVPIAMFDQAVNRVVLPTVAMNEHGGAGPPESVTQDAEMQDIGVAVGHRADDVGVEYLPDRFRACPVEIHNRVSITPGVGQDFFERTPRFVAQTVDRQLPQVSVTELPQEIAGHGQISAEAGDGCQISLRVIKKFSVLERGDDTGVNNGRQELDMRGSCSAKVFSQESNEVRGEKIIPEKQIEVFKPDIILNSSVQEGEFRIGIEGRRKPARQYD
ncbi:MAG: hypothetical protein WC740_00965 [Verrucomicrobiia bacterium]